MPTPARSATAAIGASGLATNTSRAASRISSSLRAAWARRPLRGAWGMLEHSTGTNHSVLLFCGTDCSVPTDYQEDTMDWKLELVAVPVSDVDRAKRFYVEQAGFN